MIDIEPHRRLAESEAPTLGNALWLFSQLPFLLAEIERLRIELNGYRETEGTNVACFDKVLAERDKARRERDEANEITDVLRKSLDNFESAVAARAAARTHDIERDTAERIAAWVQGDDTDTRCSILAGMIRSGAWKEPR